MNQKRFDLVIAGGGLGGLICADVLIREGYTVCVLEQNSQLGGALQIFSRDKVLFNSSVHYIGGLAPGQNLYKVFRYLGLMDVLELEPYAQDAFDTILIEGDPRSYPLAQGWDRFASSLGEIFPKERDNINAYCRTIRKICDAFPMYKLHYDVENREKFSVMGSSAKQYIESVTQDLTLRAVLAGNNFLYAGQGDETPLYVHALTQNSYIESSWKCGAGSHQIAQQLSKNIRERGGIIRNRSRVTEFVEENGVIDHVLLENGEKVYGRCYISNIHPAKTMDMVKGNTLRASYRNRIKGLRDTVGCFALHATLKKHTLPYQQTNYYFHREGRLWNMADYTAAEWPLGYALFFTADAEDPQWTSAVSLLSSMRFDEVQEWADSHHTTARPGPRPEAYAQFKARKAQQLLDLVGDRFPEIRDHVQTITTATPLTFRDYIGDSFGSMYGIAKDYRNILETQIPSRTRMRNLFLTGQNLNLHGILGTTINALITVRELTGDDMILKKIRHEH